MQKRDTEHVPTYRDDAIVLRTRMFNEADRIVILLTHSHGRVAAIAKGIRRTSSKFGSRLEPFMSVDVQLYKGKNLDTVVQAELLHPFGAVIASDYMSYTVANVMAETAERLSDVEHTRYHYLFLKAAIRSLANKEHIPSLILDSYLLRSLAYAGWAPSFNYCAGCNLQGFQKYINVERGGVLCSNCALDSCSRIDIDTIQLLAALLSGNWEIADASEPEAQKRASDFVFAYTQWHLEKKVHSLTQVDYEKLRLHYAN